MKKLCFATNNANKLKEIQALLGEAFQLQSLQETGCTEELPETGLTLEANSAQKAQYLYDNYQIDCFADDTGLEVEALNGEPGVFSARYAGEPKNEQNNIALLLQKLQGLNERKARFRTVITLILAGQTFQFDGIVSGHIIDELRGTNGFGYDPIFVPEGFDKTFAEMTMQEKGQISHRARAFQKLVAFLQELK